MKSIQKIDQESDQKINPEFEDALDPDPLAIMLEIANLVIQPGSLSLIAKAAGIGAAAGSLTTATINLSSALSKCIG